jgi:hypothetical protein
MGVGMEKPGWDLEAVRRGPVGRGWETARWMLLLVGQGANLADLGTSLWGMRVGTQETALVPAWLISRGYPEVGVLAVLKAMAAATMVGAWWAASRPWDTSWGRILSVAGLGTLLVLAGLLVGAVAHNAAVIGSLGTVP